MTNAERVIGMMAPVFANAETKVDEALIERMVDALSDVAADDLVCEMRGPDDVFVATYEGIDGLREAWRDWIETFAQVRLEIEDVQEAGDNVVTFARQVGVTRHGGVELEQPSASVFKFRDGSIVKVEFHLDRKAAIRSARDEPADRGRPGTLDEFRDPQSR